MNSIKKEKKNFKTIKKKYNKAKEKLQDTIKKRIVKYLDQLNDSKVYIKDDNYKHLNLRLKCDIYCFDDIYSVYIIKDDDNKKYKQYIIDLYSERIMNNNNPLYEIKRNIHNLINNIIKLYTNEIPIVECPICNTCNDFMILEKRSSENNCVNIYVAIQCNNCTNKSPFKLVNVSQLNDDLCIKLVSQINPNNND